MSRPGETPLPPTVRGLALVSFFNDIASEMVYPLLPAFVTGTLGASATALGALDGAAEAVNSAVKLLAGRLADRPGWRTPLMVGGYAVAVFVRPFIAAASSAGQVIGFRVADRIGKGLRTPPRDALLAEASAPEQRGRAFGYHRAADHAGAVLGALVAWAALQWGVGDVRRVIGWSVWPGVVAVGVLLLVLRRVRPAGTPGTPSRPEAVEGERSGAPEAVPSRIGATALVLLLALLAAARLPEALLLLRLQEGGVAVALVPLAWAALHVVRSATSLPAGRLADRLGARTMVTAAAATCAVALMGMALAEGLAANVLWFLAFGLVAGMSESAEKALVARLAPQRLGLAYGAYHGATGLGLLGAGIGFGAMYAGYGATLTLVASALCSLLLMVLWWLVARLVGVTGVRA